MEIKIERNKNLDIQQSNTHGYETTTPISFCFVGLRGVGKTSLLASMHHEIQQSNVTCVKIDTYNEKGAWTFDQLENSRREMLGMIEKTPKHGIVEEELGIIGSGDEKRYEFLCEATVEDTDLWSRSKNKRFRFRCEFIDIPGGWYWDASEQDKAKARKNLVNSAVSFLCIDTPPLMKGDMHNGLQNAPSRIANIYDEVLQDLAANKHTVILVLTRCEFCWNDRKAMLEKVDKYYGKIIERLKAAGIEVYVTWIQTLGGLKFQNFRKKENALGYKQVFRRDGDYVPENCATPLQIAMSRGMERAQERINPGFLSALGWDVKELAVKAANKIATELKKQLHAGEENTYYRP